MTSSPVVSPTPVPNATSSVVPPVALTKEETVVTVPPKSVLIFCGVEIVTGPSALVPLSTRVTLASSFLQR